MLFSQDEYLSDTDKIDRVYKMLRTERRGRTFWLFIRLFFFGGIIYGAYYLSLPAHVQIRTKITDIVQAKMTEFIMPMVGSMVQDLTQNMLNPGQTPSSPTATPNTRKNTSTTPPSGTSLPTNITPEMIKAVQDALIKK